jgi:hypothetical protein
VDREIEPPQATSPGLSDPRSRATARTLVHLRVLAAAAAMPLLILNDTTISRELRQRCIAALRMARSIPEVRADGLLLQKIEEDLIFHSHRE